MTDPQMPTTGRVPPVPGQQPLPGDPTPAPAPPPDDSAPAPAPPDPDGVPYAPEYVIPDPATQAQLADQVPDDPTPLPGDGHDEGDDESLAHRVEHAVERAIPHHHETGEHRA